MNSVFYLIKTIFSFLAAGFCPKNLPFARKIMVLPESGGLQPPAPLARTPMPLKMFKNIAELDGLWSTACPYMTRKATLNWRTVKQCNIRQLITRALHINSTLSNKNTYLSASIQTHNQSTEHILKTKLSKNLPLWTSYSLKMYGTSIM